MSTWLWLSHCLRLVPSETAPADLSRLSPEEWNGVIRLAVCHGIAALLYGRLQTSAWRAVVPPAGAQRLHRHYLQAAAAGLRSQQQLGKLLEALSSRSVSVMVFGDVWLESGVYGNVALRPTQELDLLVREEDCEAVASVLLSMGYGEDRVTGWYVKPHSYTLYVPPDEGDLPVRLHRQIVEPSEPYRVEVAELWADARGAAWAGHTAFTLAPESLLLQTCISGSRDFPAQGVRCCYDVAQIVQHYQAEMEWGTVVTLAQRWRADAVAHAVLSLVWEVTGAPIPSAVIASLKPESAGAGWFPQTPQQLFDASGPQLLALVDTDAVPPEGVAAAGARAAVIHCLRGRWDPAALDAARREML
ncbi:MAG TPA: nucleotidyltransferase family protein, partial [Anaerolineae bacterium]|nr:nucleotidyltransferase family protein [Anaerolineae bacterium]